MSIKLDNVVNDDSDFSMRGHQSSFDSMWAPIIPVSSMEPTDTIAFYKREKR
jgi:hypothetical protein